MNLSKVRVSATEDNIKVFCRFRPLNKSEERGGSKVIVNFPASHNGNSVSTGEKLYLFDKVFKPNATQAQVYNDAAKSIVTDVLDGYNGTIFAYGQTSSGKTHTMEGVIGDAQAQGIIPRIGHDIFNHIYGMEEHLEFQIKVSYFEIYMNKIRDLLDVTKVNLGVHENKDGVPFVRGTTERFVSSPEEIFKIIEEGRSNRQIAVTSMNEHSSRSHTIFLINIKRKNTKNQKKLSGKLYLVDLAGFEKVSKTGADGTVLDEAKNINKSLSALRNVISALTDTNKSHIPYRDSILTRILQESLGGNAKTTIIICCSPASLNESETKSTLHFGTRVKTINNVACINEELSVIESNRRYQREKAKVVRLKSIIAELQSELSRWRQGETVAPEEQINLVEGLDVTTTVTTTVAKENDSMLTIPDNEFVIRLLSNGDRKKLKEERARFCQQLNEKNEEINQQAHNLAKLEKQIVEQEKLIGSVYKDCEQLQEEISIINRKTESAKCKTKGVLQKLDELTMNDDKKSQDIKIEKKEHEVLSEVQIPNDELFTTITSWSCFEKDKSGTNNLVENCHGLETFHTDCEKMESEYKKELSECRLFIPQHDSTCEQTLLKSPSEADTSPCAWEPVNLINCTMQLEYANSTTAEEVLRNNEITELKETVSKMHVALEEQMDQLRNTHLQIMALRNEISEKQEIINELKDLNEKFVSAFEYIQTDYEELKQVEAKNSDQLQELISRNEGQEKICKNVNDMDDRVTKEMQNLHDLREYFVKDLQITTNEFIIADDIVDNTNDGGFLLQKQKILFLENNLEQLTKIHVQLLRDNVHLRCELPKLEMRLRASDERVEALKVALRDTKEAAMWERKRYQFIVHRIEENSKNKDLARRRSTAQIAKPDCIEHNIHTDDKGCVIS